MNYDNRKTMRLATAILLSSAFCVACCGSRKATKAEPASVSVADSIEQFTPLHPPVVISHDWREELKDSTPATDTPPSFVEM